MHIKPEKFENAALFLRLGAPSTLIRHENGAFRKRSLWRRNLETPALRFSTRTCMKNILENDDIKRRNPKWPMIVAFSVSPAKWGRKAFDVLSEWKRSFHIIFLASCGRGVKLRFQYFNFCLAMVQHFICNSIRNPRLCTADTAIK